MTNENDKKLFRSAIDGQDFIDKDADRFIPKNTHSSPIFNSYGIISEANLTGSDAVSYSLNGVSNKILKKMKQGKIDNVPSLDLHGQTLEEACKSMSKFIHYHQRNRFIHIIHGKGYNSDKGMSILKSQVVHYLKQHPDILAFNSCPPKDGGSGAVFALLKPN
jgi:DNA-nicking Smr family endonuclease|tara:strand:+ start:1011 stop:1499 length:489 start_codon:yes stop_codon:yes gene_type:complete